MTDRSRRAALLASLAGTSYRQAGKRLGVSRQAVSQAARKLDATPRKPGRRPSGKPPRRSVTVGTYAVKLSEDERAAFEAAAKRAGLPLATWLREQGARVHRGVDETASAWLRRAADAGKSRG